MRRNRSADERKDASEMATIITKLEEIERNTTEIKNDIKSLKTDVKENTEKIIRLDESLKSAWKRINLLERSGGNGCEKQRECKKENG